MLVPETHKPGSVPADLIDAVLLVPPDAACPRLSYRAMLIAEGYRVTMADDVEVALNDVAARGAALVFVPCSRRRQAVVALHDWLRPLNAVGVPVVLLGEGWESRFRDHRYEPFIETENVA